MITGSALLSLFIQIAIVGGVCWLLWWLIGYMGLPQPFDKVLRVIIAIAAVFFLINVLLSFGGHPMVRW